MYLLNYPREGRPQVSRATGVTRASPHWTDKGVGGGETWSDTFHRNSKPNVRWWRWKAAADLPSPPLALDVIFSFCGFIPAFLTHFSFPLSRSSPWQLCILVWLLFFFNHLLSLYWSLILSCPIKSSILYPPLYPVTCRSAQITELERLHYL